MPDDEILQDECGSVFNLRKCRVCPYPFSFFEKQLYKVSDSGSPFTQ